MQQQQGRTIDCGMGTMLLCLPGLRGMEFWTQGYAEHTPKYEWLRPALPQQIAWGGRGLGRWLPAPWARTTFPASSCVLLCLVPAMLSVISSRAVSWEHWNPSQSRTHLILFFRELNARLRSTANGPGAAVCARPLQRALLQALGWGRWG